jgi:hypothetical protein
LFTWDDDTLPGIAASIRPPKESEFEVVSRMPAGLGLRWPMAHDRPAQLESRHSLLGCDWMTGAAISIS